jgi:hypothetical protein
MNSKGGSHKARPSRVGGHSSGCNNALTGAIPAERGGQGSASPAPTTQDSKNDNGEMASDDSAVIQAILNSRGNPRLDTVQRLLKNVVSGAATVVRGTDSQRRFTSTYTEFCMSAVRCVADLEDAVFEHTHPGRHAADAADDEVSGIAEDALLKQVAAYVSKHTKSLGLAYLEHVALGALERQQQQQRKRERASGCADQRAAKSSRTGTGRGVSGTATANNSSTAGGDGVDANAAFNTLGLIDAQDTMREALQLIEREKNAVTAGFGGGGSVSTASRRRGQQAVTAALGNAYNVDRATGVFVSKASAAASSSSSSSAGGDQVVYDLRNPRLRLSSIPELSTRLQPWTVPLSSSGVFLERVTIERERKGAGGGTGASSANINSSSNVNNAQVQHAESVKTILDVCLAPTPVELLHQYETRESVLAAEPRPWAPSSSSSLSTSLSAGPYSVVPFAGKRGGGGGGGSPRSTAVPVPTPPPLAAPSNEVGGASRDAEGGATVDGEADALASSAFFPAVRENKILTCLPQFVLLNQSHLGVSRMEFVYAMSPAPKQL